MNLNLRKLHCSLLTALGCLLFFSSAKAIQPNQKALLFDHMADVNQEWLQQVEAVNLPLLHQSVQFGSDWQRIATHLQLVEIILRQRTAGQNWSAAQKANRLKLLDELQGYWQRHLFPINSKHDERRPYFIDHLETACAVGYLIQQSGHEDFAAHIAEQSNYAYIAEMDYPQLPKWAETYGFEVSELKWIQPGYMATVGWSKVGDDGGLDGSIHCMFTDTASNTLYMAGEFVDVDAATGCGSIVAWDGDNWSKLGDGIDGKVYDMEMFNNELYIAGEFSLVGQSTNANVAYWDGQAWVSTGEFDGPVYALQNFDCGLYAGGDFDLIDASSYNYFAVWAGGNWMNTGFSCTASPPFLPVNMTVNGPVRDFALRQDTLVLVGDFTTVDDSNISSTYAAEWSNYMWGETYSQFSNPISSVHSYAYPFDPNSYRMHFAEVLADSTKLHIVESYNGQVGWMDFTLGGQIDDLVNYEGSTLAVGSVNDWAGNGLVDVTYGIIMYNHSVNYDSTVTAAAQYGNSLYVAGNFKKINEIEIILPTDPTTTILETFYNASSVNKLGAEGFDEKVINSGDLELMRYTGLETEAEMQIFDGQGRLLKSLKLASGDQEIVLPTENFTAGIYFFSIKNEKVFSTGKFLTR